MLAPLAGAADYPAPAEGDFLLRGFVFKSGEMLPELRIHYRAIGTARRDAAGRVTNAVIITHGTTGNGAQFLSPSFAPELFGAGQPLDAARYFIVLPDGIGHGKSSKPSDGLRAKFPRYGYRDMVEAQYRLLTEGLGVNNSRLVMGRAGNTRRSRSRCVLVRRCIALRAAIRCYGRPRHRSWRRRTPRSTRSWPIT